MSSPATPAAALVWPMFPLTVLIEAGAASGFASRRSSENARSSVASPTAVPVPWPSRYATVSMPKPALAYARLSASRWPAASGRVMPPLPSEE